MNLYHITAIVVQDMSTMSLPSHSGMFKMLHIAGMVLWSAGGVEWVLLAPWGQGAPAPTGSEADSDGGMSGAPKRLQRCVG